MLCVYIHFLKETEESSDISSIRIEDCRKGQKLSKYSQRRKNSIAAIIFRLLYEEVSISIAERIGGVSKSSNRQPIIIDSRSDQAVQVVITCTVL